MGSAPVAAHAAAPINSFTIAPSTTTAGGHPDITTLFTVGNRETVNVSGPNCRCQNAKDLTVDAPPGLIANPHATPQCTAAEFAVNGCPIDTQVGLARVGFGAHTPEGGGGGLEGVVPLYNLVPHFGQAGLVGFNIPIAELSVFIEVSSRTESDYGLKLSISGIPQGPPLAFSETIFWGVPAASSHDEQRYSPPGCDPKEEQNTETSCAPGPHPSDSPAIPFNDNPTTCGFPLTATLTVLAYDHGISEAHTPYPSTTGCDQLTFNPSLFAQPTTTTTDTPSGLAVNLQIPQLESPTAPSPSEIKESSVTLPEGFTINPNAADGKTACSNAEARIGTEEEAQCPESSKVGSLTIESSALPGPLPGYVYLGQPQPGERYRIFLVANGFEVHVKLAGTVTPNPITGRLTAAFANLPQTPFSDLNMHFFGSERGLLATPTRCGTFAVTSKFEPWDAFLPVQTSVQYFALESSPPEAGAPGEAEACPTATSSRPFHPTFQAASLNSAPGAHTPIFLNLTRPDGDQNLSGLTVTTPPGFTATLAGVPYCPDSALEQAAEPSYTGRDEQSTPSCPEVSQIGTATVGAGAGDHPVYVSGKVYLAGPYRGAPLSLAVITPAVSGPYDLGNAVVRAALHVNPETAQITAASDSLPQILEGVPLRLRSILLELNRPNFTLNPTNCDPFSINASIGGTEGAQAERSSYFQVADCAKLPFAPKLALSLSGATKRAGSPAVRAVLTANPGEANISAAQVTLPHAELLDQAHIGTVCTKPVFSEGKVLGEKCPPSSIYGFAKAQTPLLEMPLEGPVYLRSPLPGHKLPDLVAALNGQIDIALVGKIDTGKGGGIRNTFEMVPDAPVTKFTLNLDGGSKSLLENSTNLCARTLHATADISGQNGKSANQNPPLVTPCGKKHKRKARGHQSGRALR
ncbi:MAG: hypothetical protein WB507_04930 [Solirubrobacterales bacterium]